MYPPQNSNFSDYQRMWDYMQKAKPSVFPANNQEGVERVTKGKGQYAFLMESTSIEYQAARVCNLRQVGGLLDSKGYGIALPRSESLLALAPAVHDTHTDTRALLQTRPSAASCPGPCCTCRRAAS